MIRRKSPILLLVSALLSSYSAAQTVSINSIISTYDLSAASTNFSMPQTVLDSNNATLWIINEWGDVTGQLDWGAANVLFTPDPSTSTSTIVRRQTTTSKSSTSKTSTTKTSKIYTTTQWTPTASAVIPSSTDLASLPPVLRIEYPAGSYSKKTGGTQFTSNFTGLVKGEGNDSGYQRMLLAYDVWFPSGYNWVQGGKLPGLRGGPDRTGCSGGNQTDGVGCFSTRLMWRPNGAGEVYAYIPNYSNLCTQSGVTCNSDYGTSLGRGSFTFQAGQWNTVWLLVMLNDVGQANGLVQLWLNGKQSLSFPNSFLRSSSNIASITGMFFSTFFGGDDSSWSTPTDQYTYFRNIQMYAGVGVSNSTGPNVSPVPVNSTNINGGNGSGGTNGGRSGDIRSVNTGLVGTILALIGCLVGVVMFGL